VNKLVACINQRRLHVNTYNQPQSLQTSGLLVACINFVINAGRTQRYDLRSLQRNHCLVACINQFPIGEQQAAALKIKRLQINKNRLKWHNMKPEKTDTTAPASEMIVTYVCELPYDTYAKLLKYGKRNEQLMEETVRNLIEEHCK